MDSDEVLNAIGGADFLRSTISTAANEIGVAISPADIDRVVAEIIKQWPDVIAQAQKSVEV